MTLLMHSKAMMQALTFLNKQVFTPPPPRLYSPQKKQYYVFHIFSRGLKMLLNLEYLMCL